MSRGARGGRGRRGGSARGKHFIAGQEMSWDYDPDIDTPSEPQQMFPNMGEDFPKSRPPSVREKNAIRFFKTVRDRIHQGPLHTVMSKKARISKDHPIQKRAIFDPFADLRQYTERYKKPQRELARFDTRVYPTTFFPEELLDVFNVSQGRNAKSKRVKAPHRAEDVDEDDEAANAEDGPEQGDEYRPTRKPDEDEEPEEAEPDPDETFEDDEDEMAGDYNAETYFDDGEGEEDDLAMGGGDDGGADFD